MSRSWLRLVQGGLCAAPLIVGPGCEAGAARRLETVVDFRALVDEGDPQPGVRIRMGEADLGETDAAGRLRAAVGGGPGTNVAWQAECPAPLGARPARGQLVLLPFSPLVPEAARRSLNVEIQCEKLRHTAAIVVKATVADRERKTRPLPGLPLYLGGAPAGQTDDHGLAHLDVLLGPQETAELRAGSRGEALAALVPRAPEVVIPGSTHDEVHLVAFHFSPADKARPPRSRMTRERPQRGIRIYQGGEAPLVQLRGGRREASKAKR